MVQTSLKTKMLEVFRTRMYFFMSSVVIFFVIIIIQLINLQLVQSEEYIRKSKLNMENYIPIPASRGEIYDRNYSTKKGGITIATSRPSFNITTIPAKFKNKRQMSRVIHTLLRLLDMPIDSVELEVKSNNPWERVVILEDVGFDVVVKIASHQHRFPNIDWEDAPVRVYNYGNILAHAVGYIGSISKREYKKLKSRGYKYYQKIGKNGIEKEYDKLLRGKDGFVRRIVDAKNRVEGEEIGRLPEAGDNIVLTIDYKVQKAAHDAFKDMNGSMVVLKPATGEVIALLSKPDFDPNAVISKNNRKLVNELLENKERPFLNRAIQSKYPPASTFKLVTAIAALETEKSYPDKHFFCPGKYTLRGYRDRDFYCFAAHGSLNLYWAIAKSCSVYFYQLGYTVGPTSILRYAEYLGLSEKTGVDLPGEIAGFIPSKKWKLKTFGQSWFDGDTLNLSIGQGFVSVTPIGLANMVAAIVNNGIVYTPRLVKEIRTADNRNIVKAYDKKRLRETPLKPLTLKTVKKGMRLGVKSGTQVYLNSLNVKVAGKTGTAQTRSIRGENFSQHAWYVGFAPYDAPPEDAYIVVVMVEYGMWGAARAVPIARHILKVMTKEGYFEGYLKNKQKPRKKKGKKKEEND